MHDTRAPSGLPLPQTFSCALQHIVECLGHRQDYLALQCWYPNDAMADTSTTTTPPPPWSEEEIVFLHWRLLQELVHLADPEQPLDEKFDTLRWVFTQREKDSRPFSFVQCLHVVGCSPLSPAPYCGELDAQELRDRIRSSLRAWMAATLERFPAWVREAVLDNPQWAQLQLARNPQWINEQIRQADTQANLFG